MHLRVYIKTKNRGTLEKSVAVALNELYERFSEDHVCEDKEIPNNFVVPLNDWFIIGGRFCGAFTLKKEYKDIAKDRLGYKSIVVHKEPGELSADMAYGKEIDKVEYPAYYYIDFTKPDNPLVYDGFIDNDEEKRKKVHKSFFKDEDAVYINVDMHE